MPAPVEDQKQAFFFRSAKAWQNYFDARGLLPGIEPSREQITVIQQNENQMLINGSAGTGKSITLLYKLIKTMEQEQEGQRILYVTFNRTLLDDARKRAKRSKQFEYLKGRHELHMHTFHYMAYTLLKQMGFEWVRPFNSTLRDIKNMENDLMRRIRIILESYTNSPEYSCLPQGEKFYATQNAAFFLEEILWMKANGYIRKEDYLKVERTGRSNNPRLTKLQRNTVYNIFEEYQRQMKEKFHQDMDMEDYALLLLQYFDQIQPELHYDYIYVDEVQDLKPMQIKILAKLANKSIVICGDPKQRIYKNSPHTYANLGLQIQGRKNRNLNTNFRSTKQIMALANALEFEDIEKEREDTRNFVREGEKPEIRFYDTQDKMHKYLIKAIKQIIAKDPSSTIAVIHRYEEEIIRNKTPRVKNALASQFFLITTEQYNKQFDYNAEKRPIFFTDAYSVKGLEFDHVFILQFDRTHYPHQKRIDDLNAQAEKRSSDSYDRDYDTILNDEKKILYVALTRARKTAVLLWVGNNHLKVSPFIRDFKGSDYHAYGFKKSIFAK
ncbi:MAG: DUF2075 domain-containing protein [Firmicutes bacterium]|nr:DUF2075 domain-containing protein [Bacillota bacterium]